MRDSSEAHEIAQRYIGTAAELARLGWGIGGYVYLSPNLRTAIKVFHYRAAYETEKKTYELLRHLKLTTLHGLTIPTLRGFQDDPPLIQMDFVSPPFLLDFAGVTFSPPDFSNEVIAHWHQRIRAVFGANADVVYAVYASLARRGIYYTDIRPSNINLKGLPGLLPDDEAVDEDL